MARLERSYLTAKTAEQAVIGRAQLWRNCSVEALSRLTEDDFHYPNHKILFRAIMNLASVRAPVNPESVQVEAVKQLESDEGYKELILAQIDCALQTTTATNIEYYVGLVAEHARLRQLSTDVAELKANAPLSSAQAKDALESMLRAMELGQPTEAKSVASVAESRYREIEAQAEGLTDSRLQTIGVTGLDTYLGGMAPGELWIVGARPGVGKTQFAMHVSTHVAQRKKVLFFSLEMKDVELAGRWMSRISGISGSRIRRGEIRESEWSDLQQSVRELERANNLFVVDKVALKPTEMRAIAEKMAVAYLDSEEPLGLIVLDYLQLADGTVGKHATREREVNYIAETCKQIAGDLGVPVIALSQLNRGVEKREGRQPGMADLRESGAIEAHADCILFLNRPYVFGDSQDEREATIMIGKGRFGGGGKKFDARFEPRTGVWEAL